MLYFWFVVSIVVYFTNAVKKSQITATSFLCKQFEDSFDDDDDNDDYDDINKDDNNDDDDDRASLYASLYASHLIFSPHISQGI